VEPPAVIGATGRARIAFYAIGRDVDGKREWARGTFWANVRFDKNKHWQFDTFELVSFDSLVAEKDIFSEVAVPAGVGATVPGFGTPENSGFVWHGAAAADFNNDKWIDLFVVGANRNYLYLNDQKGGFRDASEEAGIKITSAGTAPLVFDYDNDGDEDIFISAVGQQILLQSNFKQTGKLEFTDVSLESGVAKESIGFSAVAGDVNGDGRLDVYVTSYNRYGQITPNSWFRATNGTPNLLLISQKDGTFREEAARWGVDDRRWSYAAEFADINTDGKIDLYVANDFGEKALYINKGDRFVDEAGERGVLDPGNGMGVSFGDYNNDGRLDIHASNMSSTAGNRILTRLFPGAGPQDNVLKKLAAGNNLFENTGDGKFKDVTAQVGGFSGGWAWGGGFIDFDNDGDLDVFSTTIQNQSHLMFRNNVGQDNNFLRIVLEGGAQSGRNAFGSVVRVKTSAGILTKIKSGGSGFISQHDPRLLFGLGKDERAEWIEVTWSNGKVERFEGTAEAGSTQVLKEGTGKMQNLSVAKANLPDPLTKAEIFALGLKIRIGKPLPDFALKTMAGATSSVQKQLKPGRSTLINIWATWCIPCAKEMPELEKIRTRLAARGIDIIGINVDTEKNANIKKYVAEKRVTYSILVGGVPAIEKLYATDELSVPLSILVDEKGIVKDLIPGWSAETQRKFAVMLGETDAKEPVPAGKANKKR
jgi:thiol-disulfide isomerase/thioredoxin